MSVSSFESWSHKPTGPELRTQLGLQVLHLYRLVFGAGDAGGAGDLGERFFVGWRQVDHDEDAVRPIGAGAGVALGVPGQGGEELGAAFCVLQIQSDDAGQAEFTARTPAVDQGDQEREKQDGDDQEDHVDHYLRPAVLTQVQISPSAPLEVNKETV